VYYNEIKDRKGMNEMPKKNDFTVSKKIVIYFFNVI